MLQLAFCTLLVDRAARELSRWRSWPSRRCGSPLRAPVCGRPGARWPSASSCGCGCASGPATRGEGEAAPLEPYDGVPLAAVLAALDAYAAVLADAGPEDDAAALLEACRAERPLPQALAAIDLALWDRAGRRAGRPVAALLGGDAGEPVAVNALVGAEDRAGAARRGGRGGRGGLRAA